jgi:hypothetical protein
MTNQATPIPVHIAVSDPNNVPETVASGPINLTVGPEITTLILTSLRPDYNLLMKGQPDPHPKAVVAIKAVIPTSQLRGLHASIGQALGNLDTAIRASGAAPNGGVIVPSGQTNH